MIDSCHGCRKKISKIKNNPINIEQNAYLAPLLAQGRKWLWIGFACILMCCGCAGGSASSTYYTMQPVEIMSPVAEDQKTVQLVIGLGPVILPDYLDRAAIVTRVSPNRLAISDNHRWAGTLQSEILRVLAADLSSHIPAREVVIFPWSAPVEPDLRFRVAVRAFEGRPGESVTLKAAWSLTPAQSDQPALRRVSLIEEKVNGYGFEDLAAAMGNALARLSKEMAGAVSKASTSD